MEPFSVIVKSATEQAAFNHRYDEVSYARDTLEGVMAGAPDKDEDLRVACARLDNWLSENHGRWVN